MTYILKQLVLVSLLVVAGCQQVQESGAPMTSQDAPVVEKQTLHALESVTESGSPDISDKLPDDTKPKFYTLQTLAGAEWSADLLVEDDDNSRLLYEKYHQDNFDLFVRSLNCLESGFQYDKEYLSPLTVRLTNNESDEQVVVRFSALEKLSAPFSCFRLQRVIDRNTIVIERFTGDGLTHETVHYEWALTSDTYTQVFSETNREL